MHFKFAQRTLITEKELCRSLSRRFLRQQKILWKEEGRCIRRSR